MKNEVKTKHNEKKYIFRVDFKKQTPKIAIKREEPDPLYEKAFLSLDDENTAEFSLNTTTWD